MDAAARFSELCLSYRLLALWVFGSRAEEVRDWLTGIRPELPPSTSDVDVGVLPLQGVRLSVREKATLAVALEDLFDVTRVDLVVIPEADPFVAVNVIRGERLYCADSHAGDEYELYVLRRAGDLAPFQRQRLEMMERS